MEGSGINELLKKLVEVKAEHEARMREKDKKLAEANAELANADERVDLFQRENAELKKTNLMLEESMRELLNTHEPTPIIKDSPRVIAQEHIIASLKDENASLKAEAKRKNEKLEEKLK